jgi:hypothetical protein
MPPIQKGSHLGLVIGREHVLVEGPAALSSHFLWYRPVFLRLRIAIALSLDPNSFDQVQIKPSGNAISINFF